MMEVEEIDDSPSPEADRAPPTVPSKKRTKAKNSAATVPASNTLTRFLGPPGSPSLAAWEDVNRQCPVCLQKGFSSRALTLHVNVCLDGGTGGQAVVGKGTTSSSGTGDSGHDENATGVENANPGSRPPSGAAPKTAKPVDKCLPTAGSGGRERVVSVSRASAAKSTEEPTLCEEQHRSVKTAKKGKGHDSPDIGAQGLRPGLVKPGVFQSRRQVSGDNRLDARPLQPRLPNPTQPSSTRATQQAAAGRRRGLLSRAKGHHGARDTTPAPAGAAESTSKEREERAREEIARTQLLYVREATAGRAGRSGGWLGTKLFPKDDLVVSDDCCVDCGGSTGGVVCEGACVADGCGDDGVGGRTAGSKNRRVRPRPASWGARSSGEERGWFGIWPEDGDGDCWGDGDGYRTLRPFPSRETCAELGVQHERGEDVAPLIGVGMNGPEPPVGSSRADRFLQVFSQLQPARRALNLENSPPVSSRLVETTEEPTASLPPTSAVQACTKASYTGAKAKPMPVDVNAGKARSGDLEGGTASESGNPMPTSPKLKMESPVPHRINSKQRLVVENVGDKDNLQGTGRENRCASPALQTSASTEGASRTEPTSSQKHGRTSPITTSCNPRTSAHSQAEPRRVAVGNNRGQAAASHSPTVAALTPTQTSPSTSGVGGTCLVDDVATRDTGGIRCASREQPWLSKAAAKENARPTVSAMPVTLHRAEQSRAVSVPPTNVAPRLPRRALATKRIAAPPVAPALETTSSHRALQQPARDENLETSGDVPSFQAGASASERRGFRPHASDGGTSDGGGKRRVRGEAQLTSMATVPGSEQSSARPPKACVPRASSGVVRRADSGHTGRGQARSASVVLGDSDGPVGPDASDTEQASCQGHPANVLQNGSLSVVDPDHGATLRSSWSIDNSEELGKLAFGVSLDYDAVWYLPPADEDCVGVLRYRIVPHPVLAPTGGWISARGRLRDDPYTIVKANPVSTPTPSPACRETAPRPSETYCGREGVQGAARRNRGGDICRSYTSPDRTAHQQQNQRGKNAISARPAQEAGSGRRAPAASPRGGTTQPWNSNGSGRQRERHQPLQERHSQVGAAEENSRGGAAIATTSREAVPGRGSFGLATSPSAKALEACDTGDKVKCPVCHRGMDHWKPGQRQQHVHNCLLKHPSSAKKLFPANASSREPIPTASPANGGAHRLIDLSAGGGELAGSTPPQDPKHTNRRELTRGGAAELDSAGREERWREPDGSPRPTRVSLQGVFSPKPSIGADGAGDGRRQPRQHGGSTPSTAAAPATAPYQRSHVTPGVKAGAGAKQGTRSTGVSAPRKGARVPGNTATALKGPSECPICLLSFVGRQGQWERQAHIQQCLESLEGVFDVDEY